MTRTNATLAFVSAGYSCARLRPVFEAATRNCHSNSPIRSAAVPTLLGRNSALTHQKLARRTNPLLALRPFDTSKFTPQMLRCEIWTPQHLPLKIYNLKIIPRKINTSRAARKRFRLAARSFRMQAWKKHPYIPVGEPTSLIRFLCTVDANCLAGKLSL